jgi:NAD(P)-dependent dehydrogenase (short-subunit alcohol dehydrogenase family)
MQDAPLVLGDDSGPVRALAAALQGTPLAVPQRAAELEAWRARECAGARCERIAVALLAESAAHRGAVVSLDPAAWPARTDEAIARWAFALGVAAARCVDGGAIVALIERPAPLDCAGYAAESAVADAACALVRSLARSEGPRGVRVNAVATSARVAPAHPVAPPPALESFPGALDREVAGAVRLLLSGDASGITGQVLAADCGRTW